nr:alpha/beta hydrolase family protein [uncultured Faecalimonas sp.]
MSVLQINKYSIALSRLITFHVILPDDAIPMMIEGNKNYERKPKTLYLLHGFSGNTTDWLYGSRIQELAMKYNLAVVLPSGENSFYLNGKGTGRAYETFVGVELPDYCTKTFGFSDKPEDNFIGGLSMGGFGAIHTALKYPKRFGKMFGLSSAMIQYDIAGMKPGEKNEIADYDYYLQVFGNLEHLDTSENNPDYLIREKKKRGEKIQPVFMACGTEDFILKNNRVFRDFLNSQNVDLTYYESEGIHDWKFWNQYLEPAICWGLEEKVEEKEDENY